VIPLGIGVIVFACAFGAALGGMVLRTRMPDHHLTKETEDAVKVGMGMVATLAALVIGLLVASAKSSYDTKGAEVRRFAANLILLNRQLVHFGPEAWAT
jgi:fluoride ion exporter CrcB/FEX